jgi:hypothetical protein
VARNSVRFGKPRLAVAANDTTAPAAPTNADGSRLTTPVAGVVEVSGGIGLVVDINPQSTGHCSVQLLFWNDDARVWVFNGNSVPFVSAASTPTRFTWGFAFPIATKYAYAYVTGLTGTVDVWLGEVIQAGGS